MFQCDVSTGFPDGQTLQVDVYKNFDDISALQPEWDAFMESVDAEIFLSFDWCRVWWKYYGKKRQLAIFVFRHQNDICAILPLFFEKLWIGPVFIRAIRIVGADYMPVTVAVPIKENFIEQVINNLIKEITPLGQWDILYLGALCGRYPLTDHLVNAFNNMSGKSYRVDVLPSDVQTYFQVAQGWEQQIAGLAKNQRTNARRAYREINKNNLSVHSTLAERETFSQMFDNFIQMHQTHWQQLGMPGHFGAWPAAVDFHREVASCQLELNRLRLIEIKFDDQVVGYEYIFKFSDTYYWFLNARAEDKISPRIDYKWIAFHEKIENALNDGVRCIDAMRGRYEYKLLMGGKYYQSENLFIYSSTLLKFAKIELFRLLAWFANILYSKIWNARISPRLGIKRKVFWDRWIRFHPFAYLPCLKHDTDK